MARAGTEKRKGHAGLELPRTRTATTFEIPLCRVYTLAETEAGYRQLARQPRTYFVAVS